MLHHVYMKCWNIALKYFQLWLEETHKCTQLFATNLEPVRCWLFESVHLIRANGFQLICKSGCDKLPDLFWVMEIEQIIT